jgi:hypothetical protein
MVQLIPNNPNPTMAEIDEYFFIRANSGDIDVVVREIHSKSGAGALLHPAEEYFVSRYSAVSQYYSWLCSF